MKLIEKNSLSDFVNSDSLRAQLVKGTASSFMIQIISAGLSLIIVASLARLLGPEGYGAYANAMAWIGIFGAFASFGFGSLLVRDVAILCSQTNWATLKGFLRFSNGFALTFSILLTLIALGMAKMIFSSPDKETLRVTVWLASILIPLFALSNLQQSAIRGLEHVTHAMLPDMIFRPVLIIISLLVIYYGFLPNLINAPMAIIINIGAAIISFGLSAFWLQKFLPKEIRPAQPKYEAKAWINAAFPMLVYSGLQIFLAQTSTIMLGAQSNVENVGLFSVASRIAYLLIFFPTAVSFVIGPITARLYANGEKERLQKMLTLTTRITFVLSLIPGLLFLFAGDYLLTIFGPDFRAAKTTLVILTIGNLGDIALGGSALLLTMTGQEQIVAIIFAIVSLTNILLNALLIPLYGYEGAAWASAGSLILSRCILAFMVIQKLGLDGTIFGRFKKTALIS